MEAVLVTGTSGLVGYQVALRLHEAGRDVLGLDVRPAPDGAPFPAMVGDVASLETVRKAMVGRRDVVHGGAISGPMLMLDDPFGIATINLGGAIAVFEAARQAEVRRLVWLSSIAVYGDQPTLDPLPEDAPLNPRSFYGHTKWAGEALLRGYIARYGLNAVALRLSSVYGIRRQTACALTAVIEAGLADRPTQVAAEGSSFRQYIHVEDAARAVILALAKDDLPSLVYNVTGGTCVAEADLARMIQRLIPELVLEYGPPAWNEGHVGPLVITAAANDLGFTPVVSLEDGLAELHQHLAGRPRA